MGPTLSKLSLHARYVSTVSGPGADTDRIHCIWAEIQLVQYVLYLIVSEVEAAPFPDAIQDLDDPNFGANMVGSLRSAISLLVTS